jgi:3-phytase
LWEKAKKRMKQLLVFLIAFGVVSACQTTPPNEQNSPGTADSTLHAPAQAAMDTGRVVRPIVVTDTVKHDTDDPAIWINLQDPLQSLVLGTDKDEDGALYVFDLNGKVDNKRTVRGLKRPNNVDLVYGLPLKGQARDLAVVAERYTGKLRIFALPEMQAVDNGGIPIFVGDTAREPMGIALYKRPKDGAVFAIAGRKTGPSGNYLWQYRLQDDGTGQVKATLMRKFGQYSGKKEIEAIAVDNELGYVYYSDEQVGVRKYFADPDQKNDTELALFATTGFADDHEGISIYKVNDGTGYLLVSDQGADRFQVFPREGSAGNPHAHPLLTIVRVQAHVSDGSEVTNVPLGNRFPSGLFVAMSDNKTFEFYSWNDLATDHLKKAPNGVPSQ